MNLEETALNLASKGFWVFPIAVEHGTDGRKHLSFPGGRWVDVASADAATVRDMPWGSATHVGIHCEASGVVVIDLDDFYDDVEEYEYYRESLFEYFQDEIAPPEDRDDDAPAVFSQSSRGVHIYYRMDPNRPVASSVGRVAPFVDVRAQGGLLIFGGWGLDSIPPIEDLPLAPEWLAEASAPTEQATAKAPPRPPRYRPTEDGTPYGLEALKLELRKLREAWERDDGTFNHTLNSAAFAVGQLVSGGELDEQSAYARIDELLTELGAPVNQWKTLDSGFWSGYEHPRSATDFEDDSGPTDEQVQQFLDEWLDTDAFKNLPPPTWLIPGWLQTDSLVHLVGVAGHGKSFVALDMAACLSSGRSWPDHRDAVRKPVSVAYVVAEDAYGLAQRIGAWEERFGAMGDVKFLPKPVRILQRVGREVQETKEWRLFRAGIRAMKPVVIFIDTQARVTVGLNENAVDDMGVFVDQMDILRRESGAAIILVHHMGKGENATARGSSVLIGSVHTEIQVRKSGRAGEETIKVTNTKQKNVQQSAPIRFQLTPVGDSCVLIQDQTPVADEGYARSRAKQSVRSALRENGGPMSVTEVTEASGLSDRSSVRRILLWMVERGDVTKTQGQRHGQAADLYMWNQNGFPS